MAGQDWARATRLIKEATATEDVDVGVTARLVGSERSWRVAEAKIFPAASTIKLAVLVALFQDADAGRIDLDQAIALNPDAVVGGSGILAWLRPGLTLPIVDLAYLMVAVSDNTASNLLIEAVGIERIRRTMRALGLARSELNRRFLGRLPTDGEPENVTTAGDLVRLLDAIADNRAATPASCERMRALLDLQQDRDRLARRLPPDVGFGGKSGSLPGLAHDAALLRTRRGTLAVAVLTKGFTDPYRAHELIGQVGLALVNAVHGTADETSPGGDEGEEQSHNGHGGALE